MLTFKEYLTRFFPMSFIEKFTDERLISLYRLYRADYESYCLKRDLEFELLT